MTSQQALAKYNEYSEQYNKVNAVMENLVCIKGALTGASPFFEQAYRDINSCSEGVDAAEIVMDSFNDYREIITENTKTIYDTCKQVNDYLSDVENAISQAKEDLDSLQFLAQAAFEKYNYLVEREAMGIYEG